MVKEQQIISAIKNLNLSQDEKKRMFKFVDVIDIKRKRKIMSLQSLVKLIRQSNCEVLKFVIGPDWNRILFVDLNLEFKE